MAGEREGHTLQATALVHEAYLRLVGPDGTERAVEQPGAFFRGGGGGDAADSDRERAAEAEREARGEPGAGDVDEAEFATEMPSEEVLAVDEALKTLEAEQPELAKVACDAVFRGDDRAMRQRRRLGISETTVERLVGGAGVAAAGDSGAEG